MVVRLTLLHLLKRRFSSALVGYLINKSDLLKHTENNYPVVSSITGQGFDNLLNVLKTEVINLSLLIPYV